MESTLIPITRLAKSRNWIYASNSKNALWVEQTFANSKYPVATIGSQVLSIAGGLTPKGASYPLEGVLFIRVGNVQPHGLDLSEVAHIDPELHNGELRRCQLQAGDVLLAITGATFGKACVVPEDLGEANINQHIARIRTRPELNPHYLAIFFNSGLGTKQSLSLSTGGTRPALSYKAIRDARIILPPRPIQDRITQILRDAYAARVKKLVEVKNLLRNIEPYIFQKLGIELGAVPRENRFLKSINEITNSRFDFEYNLGFHVFDPYSDRVSSIDSIAVFPKETTNPSKTPDEPFHYIDIASIDIATGTIGNVQEILGADAPSRARQVVHTGDIIISSVRPTRGAIAIVEENMDGYVCSTGFSIVHPKNGNSSDYLHTVLRLSTTLEQFGRRTSGSSYPAIIERDVKETLVPTTSNREIQKEIIAEVTKRRGEAIRLRQEADSMVSEARNVVERVISGELEIV